MTTNDFAGTLKQGLPSLLSDAVIGCVEGAVDLHTHPGPDSVERSQTVNEAARDFAAAEVAGFVAKSHAMPTTNLVAEASAPLPAVPLPSITLNWGVGGLNSCAVEAAAEQGARIVWLPTKDSASEVGSSSRARPVRLFADGAALPELLEVMESVRNHELVLATGHLSAPDTFRVLELSQQFEIDNVIVTHPCLPHLNISDAEILEMAQRGAWIEHTANSLATGKVSLARVCSLIRSCSTQSTVLTGDLGQPEFGSIAGGLPLWAQCLLNAELSSATVRTLLVDNSRRAISF